MSNYRWLFAILVAVGLAPASLAAQESAIITGRVAGEAGQPVAGASVSIPALNIGTLVRNDGTYNLILPAGRFQPGQEVQITAQQIGYRSQTATVTLTAGARLTQDFQLATDVLQLEGIVATGIGQVQTRERLGTTINSVTADDITRAPAPNMVQAMAGKAPNVEVQVQSGEPGSGAYIRIRGVNTIAGSGQPLFVVDGVPINNSQIQHEQTSLAGVVAPNRASDINPNDIASMEILKGAAAAAIYGARAANGVVLITTKSGQAGVTRATFTSTATIDRVNQGVPLQRSFGQGSAGATVAGHPFSWGPQLAGGTPTFDHFGEMFRDGQMLENNLALSGGTERTRYYLSAGLMNHQGTIVGPNNFYNRTTARLRASHQLLENLTVGGNFAYAETNGAFIQKGSNISGLLLGALRTPPEFDNRSYLTEDGLHRSYRLQNPTRLVQSRGYDNPFFVVNEHRNRSELGRAFGNITLDYTPFQWLTVNYTLGNDYWSDERLTALPPSSSDWAPGRLTRGQFKYNERDHNLVATGTQAFTDQVGGSLTVGYNRNARDYRQINIFGRDFVAPDVFNLNNTIEQEPNEYEYLIRSESFFAQAQADILDQLFFTAALRNDGFSTFGQSERRHWFPKVSAAWDVTQTLGFRRGDHPILGFAKLRAAWGQAGNEPDPYQTITAFATNNFTDGGWGPFLNPTYAGRGGLWTSTTLGQEALRPERTSEFETGIDLSLIRDIVGVQFTYYNALTRDAIFLAPVAPTTGFTQQIQNAATIRNEGVELTVDVRALQLPNFNWEIGGQFGRNNNRVLDLGDPDREFVFMPGAFAGAPGAAVRGFRVGVLRGNDFYRCRPDEDQPAAIAQACAGAPAGAVYVGEDGFPMLDPTDRVIADPHPDWTAGIRNTFTLFNNLNITALLDIRRGGDVWNGTRGALYHFGTHADTEQRGTQATYADFSGQAVAGPGASQVVTFDQSWFTGLGSGFGPVAAQFIEDGSYVKLREIAVSYDVPTAFAGRIGMSGVNLRVSGRNLATWTDYTGIDPETNLAGNTNLRGVDYFNNPQTRSFVFTVGLNR